MPEDGYEIPVPEFKPIDEIDWDNRPRPDQWVIDSLKFLAERGAPTARRHLELLEKKFGQQDELVAIPRTRRLA